MKKYLLITALFLFSYQNFFSQTGQNWKWLWPQPQGNQIKWIKIWNSEYWYALGDNGTFMVTTNAGQNWSFHHNASDTGQNGRIPNLNDAEFINENTGYLAFNNGTLYKTTNAGGTFYKINSFPPCSSINDIYIENPNLIYTVVTGLPAIIYSINGGSSWSNISIVLTDIKKIFTQGQNILISTENTIAKSTNSGFDWDQVFNTAGYINFMFFKNYNTGYITGNSGLFRYTTNAGTNWYGNNITGYDLNNIFVESINTILVNESFENTIFPPVGWFRVNVSGTNYWQRSTSYSHSGSASAYINYQSWGGQDWLITPRKYINNNDSIIFWLRKQFPSAFGMDSLLIYSSSSDSAIGSFTNTLGRINVNNLPPNIWTRFSYPLSPVAGSYSYFAFVHKDSNGNGCYIDDIDIGGNNIDYDNIYLLSTIQKKILSSTNNGFNWSVINYNDPLQLLNNTPSYISKNQNLFIVSGDGGFINKSVNNGINWSAISHTFSKSFYNDIWNNISCEKIIAVGQQSNNYISSNIIYSVNAGVNWSTAFSFTAANLYSLSMVNDNTGYSAGFSVVPSYAVLKRTTTGGITWDSIPINNQPNLTSIYDVEFINQQTGWIFGNKFIVMKTTNSGINWFTQYQDQSVLVGSAADMKDNTYGIYVGYNNSVIITTNGGLNWLQKNIINNVNWRAVKYTINNTCFITGENSNDFTAQLFKSTDNCSSWFSLNVPISHSIISVDALDNNNVMIGGANGQVASTTNGGQNWNIEFTGSDMINSIKLLSIDTALIATGHGIMVLKDGFIGNINYIGNFPDNYKLYQNYPNPLNPVTTIKFSLPKSGIVTLKIYEITGREVMVLLNNADLNSGTINYNFDASYLSSGVYFYSLYVNNNLIDTKKMIIIK